MNGNKFEYAYAITTHLSQGSQYVKGMYYMENMNPREKRNLDYTAITRFSKYCTVIIPHKKFYQRYILYLWSLIKTTFRKRKEDVL